MAPGLQAAAGPDEPAVEGAPGETVSNTTAEDSSADPSLSEQNVGTDVKR